MDASAGSVNVWVDAGGRPEGLAVDGIYYRVSDSPSLLELDDFALTHPPSMAPGWRFQATSDDGYAFVFDIRWQPASGTWGLEHSWG